MTNTIGQREKLEAALSPFFSAARQIDDLPACDRFERQRELEVEAASFVLAALSSPPAGEGEPVAWRARNYVNSDWMLLSAKPRDDEFRRVEPLYAHPPSPGVEKTGGREALAIAAERLANAADSYGVAHLDSDDLDEDAEELQAATLALRAILALSPTSADREALSVAARNLIDRMSSTYKARNGRDVGVEADDGEKVWLVHSDEIEALRAALSPTSGGGTGEIAQRLADAVPCCLGCYPKCEAKFPDESCCVARRALSAAADVQRQDERVG